MEKSVPRRKLPGLYCLEHSTVRINAGHLKGRAMFACEEHWASVAKAVALDKKRAVISFIDDQETPCDWGTGLPWIWEKAFR